MSKADAAAIFVRLSDASSRIRRATQTDDVLDEIVGQASQLAGAAHAWAACIVDSVVTSMRSTSDENAPFTTQRHPEVPPLVALLEEARPVVRADGLVAFALPGSGGATEGVLVLTATPQPADGAIAPDSLLDLVLGELATVGGLALEAARSRSRVSSVLRAREVLLASISHDLRNPLNTFAMSVGLLRDDLERNDIDPTRGITLIGRMERASTRMQTLIEDLGEASRIDARKIEYALREEHAANIVRDVVSSIASERGAAVTCDGLDDEARVLGDRARIRQLLTQVIAFEAKFTGDGGSIKLGVGRQGDTVVFTARALGPGGVSVARAEDGRGGLALLIARGLAERQNGTFCVDSGDGLAVVVTLPAAK